MPRFSLAASLSNRGLRRRTTSATSVEYLIVAGGGGGGVWGGGGGGGGLLQGSMSLTLGSPNSISVGGGGAQPNPLNTNAGAGAHYQSRGSNGGNSSALGLTATGGGGGGTYYSSSFGYGDNGLAGGSGGGAGALPGLASGGAGIAGQGNAGGTTTQWGPYQRASRGGGGAGAAASSGHAAYEGPGGAGKYSSITGTNTAYAGGGGGHNSNAAGNVSGGIGGGGIGGGGGSWVTVSGTTPITADPRSYGGAGVVNTGGGGGGGVGGGAGGSGVVILKYPDTYIITIGSNVGLTYTTDSNTVPGFRITTFTAGTGSFHIDEPTAEYYLTTGTATITGTAQENSTLTASNNLADVDGLSNITYVWNRDGVAITGATATTYTLVTADVGTVITVTVSYTEGGGTSGSVTSLGTNAVTAAPVVLAKYTHPTFGTLVGSFSTSWQPSTSTIPVTQGTPQPGDDDVILSDADFQAVRASATAGRVFYVWGTGSNLTSYREFYRSQIESANVRPAPTWTINPNNFGVSTTNYRMHFWAETSGATLTGADYSAMLWRNTKNLGIYNYASVNYISTNYVGPTYNGVQYVYISSPAVDRVYIFYK